MKGVSWKGVVVGVLAQIVGAALLTLPLVLVGVDRGFLRTGGNLPVLLAFIWLVVAFFGAHFLAGFSVGKVAKDKRIGSVLVLAALFALVAIGKGGLIWGLIEFCLAACLYGIGAFFAK